MFLHYGIRQLDPFFKLIPEDPVPLYKVFNSGQQALIHLARDISQPSRPRHPFPLDE